VYKIEQLFNTFLSFYICQESGFVTPTPPMRVKSCGLRIPGENTINDVPDDVKNWLGKKYTQSFSFLFQQT
jgi:hypothetical protein